jgi:hypothetical protein
LGYFLSLSWFLSSKAREPPSENPDAPARSHEEEVQLELRRGTWGFHISPWATKLVSPFWNWAELQEVAFLQME